MKNVTRFLSLIGMSMGASGLLLADPAPIAPVDSLTEALPVLRAQYLDFAALHYATGDRLEDLIVRSKGGLWLEKPEKHLPIYATLLPGNVVYVRMATFTPATSWADLAKQVSQWSSPQGLILDLRSNFAMGDLAGAAQAAVLFGNLPTNPFAGDFAADSSLLAQPIQQPMIVLVNHQTDGAAEAVALALQRHGAIVMGRYTEGHPQIFAEQTLTSGQILHYAKGAIHWADGSEIPLQMVTPDVPLLLNDQAEKRALTLVDENSVLDVIHEKDERQRLSEASLVNGEDPERDRYLATLDKNSPIGRLTLPLVEDTALIQALDSLTAIRVSQRIPLPTGGEATPVTTSASR